MGGGKKMDMKEIAKAQTQLMQNLKNLEPMVGQATKMLDSMGGIEGVTKMMNGLGGVMGKINSMTGK